MAAGDYEKKQAREAEARHKRLQKIGGIVPPIGAPMGHKKKDVAKKMGEISPERRKQLYAIQAFGEQHPHFRSREMGHYRRVLNREHKESKNK